MRLKQPLIMKSILQSSLFLFGFLGLMSSCEEIPPVISSCETESVVLIEEYTGVKCVNCPTGAAKIKQLINQHSSAKLVSLSIHTGYFAVPYPESTEDFRLSIGEALDQNLGPVTSYPSAMINRKIFAGENSRVLSLNKWAGYIEREFCNVPPFNIQILNNFDPNTRTLQSTVQVNGINNPKFDQALGLSIYISENNIESMQLDHNGIDSTYIHEHVLRHSFYSTVSGFSLYTNTELPFQNTLQNVSYTLPNHWKAEDCHVIAIVHYTGANGKFDILQAGMSSLN